MPLIFVKLFEGRSDELKCQYAKALTEASVTVLGCTPQAVDIVFEGVKKSDWTNAGVLWSDRL